MVPGIAFASATNTTTKSSQSASKFLIKPVAQRDPNPLLSERLEVNKISWVVPHEVVKEIDQAEIDEFLAQALADQKKTNAPAAHGFTQVELEEVARLLGALGIHDPATKLTQADLSDLQAVVAAQKNRRGVSVVQLQEIANALEQKVQDKGFGLATAYVPAQAVMQGEVEIHVQLGALADVVVLDPEAKEVQVDSSKGLRNRFGHLIGKAVRSDALESELNRLNRIPGMTAQGKFVPGPDVGDTVLELNVNQTNAFVGAAQIDNYGYEPTGESRLALSSVGTIPVG